MDAVQVRQTIHDTSRQLLLFQSEFEFVSAVEDHDAKEATLLRFRKGDIIRIIRKKQVPKGRFESISPPCFV